MCNLMTIQTFSRRTGIPNSALRYYEEKGLLYPKRNSNNDYRLYSKEQIPIAKLIASLRLADVPLTEIQTYLNSNETVQQEMRQSWIEQLKLRRQYINASLNYLESTNSNEQVYLLEKNAETIVWFAAEGEQGKFGQYFMDGKKELDRLNIPINNSYLRYISGEKLVKAQIGFGIPDDAATEGLKAVDSIEEMDACLCIGISYRGDFTKIESGYHRLTGYASRYHWIPAGKIFEWYRGKQFLELDIVMPVIRIGGNHIE